MLLNDEILRETFLFIALLGVWEGKSQRAHKTKENSPLRHGEWTGNVELS